VVFSAWCNIYISCLCYDFSVRLSVTEVHWHIIANLGFKFRSQFTAHCGRGACGREGRDHDREQWRDHLALCYPLLGPLVYVCYRINTSSADNHCIRSNWLVVAAIFDTDACSIVFLTESYTRCFNFKDINVNCFQNNSSISKNQLMLSSIYTHVCCDCENSLTKTWLKLKEITLSSARVSVIYVKGGIPSFW